MSWFESSEIPFGDRILWACVLRRSVFDYVLYKGVGKHRLTWQMSHRFIFLGESHEAGLTFDEICSLFDWEPDYLRRLVRNLKRNDITKLEAMRFKEEFDGGDAYFHSLLRWSGGASVPFMIPSNFSSVYQSYLKLRPIRPEKRLESFPPIGVVWAK